MEDIQKQFERPVRLEQHKAYIKWDNQPAYSQLRTAELRFDDGREFIINKHSCGITVKVSNGPFSVGREWFTIGDGQQEFDKFDDAINSLRSEATHG